ncbi:tumor necrosis factor receptor superfamily member 4 [Betta splendens]|uniref:Tumor necrosis factor receptor superfamily member 4 n=1 Tax=Betta splendens TaxID=158456 RepID=A0A6P7MMH1_BETSP|nr:tumor necrosis factor receptor superfamily member 4 [Betta splendens]
MLPPKLLLLSLAVLKLISPLEAKRCGKGYRTHEGHCAPCPKNYYQPEENDSATCTPCTRCSSKDGSLVKDVCTSVSNTRCQCRPGFVSLEPGSITCYCDVGFGNTDQECVKCRDGYFNNIQNSPCQKWKECKSGVKTPGNTTSDVTCNDPSDDAVAEHFLTRLTSLRPREEPRTRPPRATTTATAASPHHRGTTRRSEAPTSPSSTDYTNYIGMALLIFGVVGLVMLTAVTCKLHIFPCLQEKQPEPHNPSCRRPVEESGDGSLSILKVNAEEP